ncbi:MAG: hypothetical protein JGK21_05135 [Microcoleus sp. PH2017_22_RUC_O_B]|uniref:hypothetical protein n=1 Tax=unclassified Microcoleus TaxID=2642155 RepID=UPI001DB07000|nr:MULTISPECIES: hypothetical protein [unclassified Microcoleus]MCC3527665.1 hypothetical protein [Microcoleus sp. PH2017_21_RUC_O_A]MCC3539767.1 hypothetical protein [Microcoleus sp. PH2017_22_RUC_O_B]
MENHDIIAFILAVLQQTEQLPAPVQSEFNKISENFTIADIERLAELHPSLLAAYEYADDCLMNGDNRSKRSDAKPDESEEDNPSNTELVNIIRSGDITDRKNLNQIINTVEAQVKPGELKEFLKEILKAGDSVQATKKILSLIADRLHHE